MDDSKVLLDVEGKPGLEVICAVVEPHTREWARWMAYSRKTTISRIVRGLLEEAEAANPKPEVVR